MLPVIDEGSTRTFSQILLTSVILIPISLIPVLTGLSGMLYFFGALLSGVGLLLISQTFIKSRSLMDAKRLLRATVIYLPVLLIFIVFDQIIS